MTTLYADTNRMMGENLPNVMAWCANNGGIVHIDRECLFCAYPTSRLAIETQSKKGLDKADTLYVYIASGNLKRAFQYIEPMEFLAFERFDGKFRVYDFERFRRLVWVAPGTNF